MLPYQPNSDALLPPPALTVFVSLNLFSRRRSEIADSFFARALLLFFSDLSLAFVRLGFVFGDGLGEAFATSVFLGVGFGIGFGVVLALNAGVALGFAWCCCCCRFRGSRWQFDFALRGCYDRLSLRAASSCFDRRIQCTGWLLG